MDKTTMVLHLRYPEAGGDADGMFILHDVPSDIESKVEKWIDEGTALYGADDDGIPTDIETYLFDRLEEAGIKYSEPEHWLTATIEF